MTAPIMGPVVEPMVARMDDGLTPEGDSGLLKRRSVRGIAATFIGQGLRFVLQFGSQIALARLLLPGEFGLVAMLGPVVSFVTIFNELGLTQATVQRARITHQELSNLFWINLAVSAALAVLMAVCAPLIAWFYGESRLVAITLALAVLLVVSGLSAQPIALMNRTMRFVPLAVIDGVGTAVTVAVGIGAAWAGFGYWSLVLMQAANALSILVLSWICARWRPTWPRREAGIGALLRFGGHMTAYNLVIFAGSNIDLVLIGKLGGSIALGLYDRAFKLVAAPVWTISIPVARVAVSLLSRLHDTGARYRRAYLLLLQVLLMASVPAVAFAAAASATLVPFLLGPAWTPAAPIVAWLAIATGFAPLSISASWLFVSQDRAGEQMRYAGLRTAVALLALAVGLGVGAPGGALGVARAYACFGLLVHGLPLWGATRRGPVGWRDVAGSCLPFALGGGVAIVAVRLADARMAAAGLSAVARLPGEAVLAYGACAAAMAVLPEGRRFLRGVWDLRAMLRPGGSQESGLMTP